MNNILIITKNKEEEKNFEFLINSSYNTKFLTKLNSNFNTTTELTKILQIHNNDFKKAEVIIISDIEVYTNFLVQGNILSSTYFPNLKEIIFSPLNNLSFNLILDYFPYEVFNSKYNVEIDDNVIFSKITRDSRKKYVVLSNTKVKLKGNVTFFFNSSIEDNGIYVNRVFSKNKFLTIYKKLKYILPSGMTSNQTVITPINSFEKNDSKLLELTIINLLNKIQ